MQFDRSTLDGIKRGAVTLAFRRWKKPAVKPGSRVRTAAGEVRIGKVQEVSGGDITATEARLAGFPSIAALRAQLRSGEDRTLFRVEITGLDPDRRLELRERRDIDVATYHAISDRFERWDRTRGVRNYHLGILEAIEQEPAAAAARLATRFEVEKLKFKQDVRRLKELGLTESLAVGYRLSPRGAAFLEQTRERAR